MGFEYYSVSHATLDQVFLSIVSKHNIEEENAGHERQHDTTEQSMSGRLRRQMALWKNT
jgi:ATP-binding cassette subfamily A (ABC1) protein 3